MARCTRSIVLVLIGTGLAVPGCDDRQRRPATTSPSAWPAEPGDVADAVPWTPPYGYGPMYHAGHPSLGWWGGTLYNGRRGYAWDGGGSPWGRPSSPWGSAHNGTSFGRSRTFARSSSGSSSSRSRSGSSFGGFGSHATGGASS